MKLRLQRSASESTTIILAEEICATVPQLLSYSDYLGYVVDSTGFKIPERTRSPDRRTGSMASSSSEPTRPVFDDSSSGVSTPEPSMASSPRSTASESSCSSSKDKNESTKIPRFAPGNLDPASAFHLLLKLHNLVLVPWLPFSMKNWIQGRIQWIEKNSDPYSAARLKDMVSKRPCDGFPVSDAPGQVPYGGICETIAIAPADQRLWFLAHSWLFVGIDWNADYYSEVSIKLYFSQRSITASEHALKTPGAHKGSPQDHRIRRADASTESACQRENQTSCGPSTDARRERGKDFQISQVYVVARPDWTRQRNVYSVGSRRTRSEWQWMRTLTLRRCLVARRLCGESRIGRFDQNRQAYRRLYRHIAQKTER